jgi:phosphonate transport system substrate-binding protein
MLQFRKKSILFPAAIIALLVLAACSEKKEAGSLSPGGSVSTDSFVIALLPEQNVFVQKKRYKPLTDYLSKAIGMNVKTKLLDSYDAIYNEMLNDDVDAAFMGSLSYVVMNSKLDIDPIARPLLKNGISTYKGVIFAPRDKGITGDVRTWKGRKIALINKSTTAGYIFPKYYLYNRGVKNFDGHFRKVIYTGSHDASVLSVFRGDADMGCAKDDIFEKLTSENPLLREKLVVLAAGTPVPNNTLAIRKDRDDGLKARIRGALLGMDKTPGGAEALSALGAARFIETRVSEYGPIVEMLETIGMKPGDFALDLIGRPVKPPPRKKATEK